MTAAEAVVASLSNNLRRPKYRNNPNPLAGHCYVASESFFYLLGGYNSDWRPCFLRHEEEPHWFLVNAAGEVLDLTVTQFKTVPNYRAGVRKGFLTRQPSKRAQQVIELAKKLMGS